MNDERSATNRSRQQIRRVAVLIAVFVALWAVGLATGAHEYVTVDRIRAWIAEAGLTGVVLFVAMFAVGQVAQVSGHVFIAASVFAWGWWQGGLISVVAATAGAVSSFAFARAVGGDVRSVQSPRLQRVLAHLDRAPFRSIAAARLLFMTAPPLAPAFALSGVRYRDHAVGSFFGLIPSVLLSAYVWGIGFDWLELVN